MSNLSKNFLSHVLWIGGATDSGKSTVAQKFAERHQFDLYHYDKVDQRHHKLLATKVLPVRKFLEASLDERWVYPSPVEMLDYLFTLFPHRFHLLIEDLLAKPKDRIIVVEGFGLLPELVQPYLCHRNQAIWFIPTRKFKWESMERRGKPSFGAKTCDPERAKINLFERDMLLANYYREKVLFFNYQLHETNGTLSIDETTDLVETHFQAYLNSSAVDSVSLNRA